MVRSQLLVGSRLTSPGAADLDDAGGQQALQELCNMIEEHRDLQRPEGAALPKELNGKLATALPETLEDPLNGGLLCSVRNVADSAA
jgi:hypothetical protein